jgi:hypothetical protein
LGIQIDISEFGVCSVCDLEVFAGTIKFLYQIFVLHIYCGYSCRWVVHLVVIGEYASSLYI